MLGVPGMKARNRMACLAAFTRADKILHVDGHRLIARLFLPRRTRRRSVRRQITHQSALRVPVAAGLCPACRARFSSRSWAEVLNIAVRVPSTANRRSCSRQKSRWKSINLKDYRSIGIFWRDRLDGIRIDESRLRFARVSPVSLGLRLEVQNGSPDSRSVAETTSRRLATSHHPG
jgi:hypothetical protein